MIETTFSYPHLAVELFIKGTAIFLFAGICATIMRNRSAATRNLVWRISLICTVFLPIFVLCAPSFPVMTLPAKVRVVSIQPVKQNIENQSPLREAHQDVPVPKSGNAYFPQTQFLPESRLEMRTESAIPASTSLVGEGNTPPNSTNITPNRLNLFSVCIGLWLVGFGVCLVRMAKGSLLVRSLHRAALPTSRETLQLAEELAKSVGLKRAFTIVQSAPNGVARSPMTWGHFAPVILLPEDSESWNLERKKAVLLHEFAHISRADWLALTLANLLCALYWCHPLCWLAAMQMRRESELACDDIVLCSGLPASDYASHLMAVVANLNRCAKLPGGAIPMAQFGQTETRIRSILDNQRRRNGVTNLKTGVVICFSLAALFACSSLKVKAQSPKITLLPEGSPAKLQRKTLLASPRIAENRAAIAQEPTPLGIDFNSEAKAFESRMLFDSNFVFAQDSQPSEKIQKAVVPAHSAPAAPQPQVVKKTIPTASLEKAMVNEKKIFWGKPVNGLQAGIEMWGGTEQARVQFGTRLMIGQNPDAGKNDPSVIRLFELPNRYIQIGETSEFQIHIRNVGKTILTFSAEGYADYEGRPFNWSYEASNAVGKRGNAVLPVPIKISRQLIVNGRYPLPLEISLAPGAQFTIPGPAPKFRMVQEGVSFNSESVIGLKLGSYNFSVKPFLQLMTGRDNWVRNLATGIIKVGVMPPPVQTPVSLNQIRWGEVADGLQSGIRFVGEDSHFKEGERMEMNCFIRNTTNSPVSFSFTRSFTEADLPKVYDTVDRLGNPSRVTSAFFTGLEGASLLTLGAGETLYFKHSGLSIGKSTTNKKELYGDFPYLENAVPGVRTLKQSFRYRIKSEPSKMWKGLSVREFDVMSFISKDGVETKREILTVSYSSEKSVLTTGPLPFEIMGKER